MNMFGVRDVLKKRRIRTNSGMNMCYDDDDNIGF